MLKKIFLLFLIGSLTFVKAQETDLLSIPNPVEYDGTEFFLARAKQRSKTLFQQQYIPKDEQLENFNQIIDFSFFNKEIEMELAVRQKVESVQSRKDDKFAKVNVTESPDGTEYIVDFYISEVPEKGDSFIEYDIYRFKKFDNGTQKSFLMLNYAKRIYGDLKSAAKLLAKQRDQLMTGMIEYKIPEIKVLAVETKK
ncbi:hypothetical protein J4771_03355 [Candidatus Kaistella beijingensis]|uniref:hypothetical protein n=1 Tax=Candidatus Kaistella beijingensis TaxID=2820270 RepID=UPI001CC5EB9E|nr:hypothetical protein [Candidatus Kaistella beijingensis]UBB90405.1 hypothetical protein J4771_03355 [Candidatus Kaistella beijingensis]